MPPLFSRPGIPDHDPRVMVEADFGTLQYVPPPLFSSPFQTRGAHNGQIGLIISNIIIFVHKVLIFQLPIDGNTRATWTLYYMTHSLD